MTFITIKPAEGLRVIMPPALGATRGLPLDADGQRVALTPFVQRRLECGDVVKIEDAELLVKEEKAPAVKGATPAAAEPAPSAGKASPPKQALPGPGPVEEAR